MFSSLLISVFLFTCDHYSAAPIECSTAEGKLGKCILSFQTCKTDSSKLANCDRQFQRCCPLDSNPTVYLQNVEGCGVVRNLFYVVGGTEASPHSFPWVVGLFQKTSRLSRREYFFCGGSLINNQFVLTAAHCVYRSDGVMKPEQLVVKLGSHEIMKDGTFYDVAKVIPHENYRSWKHYNDIALLKLSKKVEFTNEVYPICLPTKEMSAVNYDNQSVELTGWGTTSFQGSIATKLQRAAVAVVPNAECNKSYSSLDGAEFAFPDGINDNFICAGLPEGGKDTCQGDSGGPLMFLGSKGEPSYQLGVVSFGYECAKPGYPGVYTRVAYQLGWIGNRVAQNSKE